MVREGVERRVSCGLGGIWVEIGATGKGLACEEERA